MRYPTPQSPVNYQYWMNVVSEGPCVTAADRSFNSRERKWGVMALLKMHWRRIQISVYVCWFNTSAISKSVWLVESKGWGRLSLQKTAAGLPQGRGYCDVRCISMNRTRYSSKRKCALYLRKESTGRGHHFFNSNTWVAASNVNSPSNPRDALPMDQWITPCGDNGVCWSQHFLV